MHRSTVTLHFSGLIAVAILLGPACASDDKGSKTAAESNTTAANNTQSATSKPTAEPVAKKQPAADKPVPKDPPAAEPPAKVEPKPAAPPAKLAGRDFIAEARALYKATVCRGDAALPSQLKPRYHKRHCGFINKRIARYKNNWLAKARPFFDEIVPDDIGDKIVYPFGGGDLMTVLAVFPKLREATTISLEPSGDPRAINTISQRKFERYWAKARHHVASLLVASHSRTIDMIEAMNYGHIPGEVIYSLIGLAINDMEPVSLRYFRVEKDGTLAYVTAAEIEAADKAVKQARGGRARRKAQKARKQLFANMELQFRKPGGELKIFRHIRANLGNKRLKKDPRIIKHLEAKGKVPAMTKAASYLLWHNTFSIIRNYLLKHMTWMVSDATGIPPHIARKHGFEQLTWGRFQSHIPTMGNPGQRTINRFVKLWKKNPKRALRFPFGYAGGKSFALFHLMVTRPAKK